MRIQLTMVTALAAAIFTISCEKTIEDPYERAEGKWIIKSTAIGSLSVPEDGSYLIFNGCTGSNCTGVDFRASDTTTGNFDFSISEGTSKTLFFFTDTLDDGGWYNGEYEATLFTNNSLNLEAESILGTARIEMKKQ